jgi:hypothetical protein
LHYGRSNRRTGLTNKILIALIVAAIAAGGYFIGHALEGQSSGVLSTVLAEPAQAAQATAQANLATAAGDAASYYADHQTYMGMTSSVLRASYDAGLSSTVDVKRADSTAYCIDSDVSGAAVHLNGPGGAFATGPC